MPRFTPLTASDLPDFKDVIEAIAADHGYIPNSFLTQGRVPGLLHATGRLADALWYSDSPRPTIRYLTAFGFSFFSGAMYSAAHTGEGAARAGITVSKLQAIADYAHNPAFTAEERAVLDLCAAAARAPARVTDHHITELRRFFDDLTILRITGLIAWHAFLNKWNDLCATRLEDRPRHFAETSLRDAGWHLNSHG